MQDPPRGTGDAVRTALRALAGRLAPQGDIDDVLVLFGDTPLLRTETIVRAARRAAPRTGAAVAVAGMRPADPGALWPARRSTRDGALERIVEAADASPEERAIGLVQRRHHGDRGAPRRRPRRTESATTTRSANSI